MGEGRHDLGQGRDQAVVLVRRADREPEVVRQRVRSPEGARHEAAPEQRVRDRHGPGAVAEPDEQEVRDGRPRGDPEAGE